MKTTLIFWRNSHLFWLNFVISVLTVVAFIVLPSCENDESTSLNDEVSLKTSNTTGILYYGHKTLTRGTGTPVIISQLIENPDFDHFEDNFILQIQNGKDSKTRVSSAEIWIDGVLVVGPSDFSQNVSFISRQLSCLTPESLLEVKLSGKPGSCIDLWIEGCLKPGRALVGPEGGSIISGDGTVEVIVPNGALIENEILGINVLENQFYKKSEIAEIIGPVIQLIGYEDLFLKDVVLKIRISPNLISNVENSQNIATHLVREDLNAYLYQESIYDVDSNTLSTNINHFSFYVIIVWPIKLWTPDNSQKYYWSIKNYPSSTDDTPSSVTQTEVNVSINNAICTWGKFLSKVGYSFEQEDYSDFSSRLDEIRISWIDNLTLIGGTPIAAGGWSLSLDARVVFFNDKNYPWIANKVPRNQIPFNSEDQSIRAIMLHEFGHVLGFVHLYRGECPDIHQFTASYCYGPAIMAPNIGEFRDYFELDPIDIERLCSKYGINLDENPLQDESYTLDSNQVPSGWEFFETNEEVSLKDGRLVATPVDAYGGLRRNGTMPAGTTQIKFEWDGNLSYSYWGMLNILKLNYGANKDLAVYLETAGVWSTTYNYLFLQENYGSGSPVEREKHLYPLKHGNFHYTVTVTDREINFVCTNLSSQELYVSRRMNIPSTTGLTLRQMTGYEFITYTTTDNDNWLDNISVTLIR